MKSLDGWSSLPPRCCAALKNDVAKLPMQFFDDAAQDERWVKLRRSHRDTPIILSADWWGSRDSDATGNAVRVGPRTFRALGSPGSSETVDVSRAGWWDVIRYARGFRIRVLWALLIMIASVVAAIASFLSSQAPIGIALAALSLVCLAAIVRAGVAVARAAPGRA